MLPPGGKGKILEACNNDAARGLAGDPLQVGKSQLPEEFQGEQFALDHSLLYLSAALRKAFLKRSISTGSDITIVIEDDPATQQI